MKINLHMCCMRPSALILPFLMAASAASAQVSKVRCALVSNAKIAQHSLAKEGKFGRANYGHQIAAGAGNVLALRVYANGSGPPDSQLFKKATLEIKALPDILAGEEVRVEVHRSFYAHGASGWVADGGYWWAQDPFQHVYFRRDNSGLNVTLKGAIYANFASKVFPRPKQSIQVDIQCPVVRQSVVQLTPWIGRVGTTWGAFYSGE